MEVEVYDCGCQIRYYSVDSGEAAGDMPKKPILVPEHISCPRHQRGTNRIHAPSDARLVTVLHENENFLNE